MFLQLCTDNTELLSSATEAFSHTYLLAKTPTGELLSATLVLLLLLQLAALVSRHQQQLMMFEREKTCLALCSDFLPHEEEEALRRSRQRTGYIEIFRRQLVNHRFCLLFDLQLFGIGHS